MINKAVKRYWLKHYVKSGMCSLCGNRGLIDTTHITINLSGEPGRINFCICPNGQTMRYIHAIEEKRNVVSDGRRGINGD